MKNKIRDCFNKAYLSYDHSNHVQTFSGKHLINFLLHYNPQSHIFKSIIDLGCGTGCVTQKLAKTLDYETLFAIDFSYQLLLIAKQKLFFSGNQAIKLIQTDFDEFDFKLLFNLAFSNMALHWSIDIQKTFSHIYHHLDTRGLIAFSIPISGTFSALSAILPAHFYTTEQIISLLSETGFKNIAYLTKHFIQPFETILSALKSIKATGSHYTHVNPKYNHLLRMRKNLHKKQAVSLDYTLGFFVAHK